MRELLALLRRLRQMRTAGGSIACGWCGAPLPSAEGLDEHVVDCLPAMAEFARVARDKQLAVMMWVSSHLSEEDGLTEEEVDADSDAIAEELAAGNGGMGAGALQRANTVVILHLVRQLARERGQSAAETWRREAAEMLREPGRG